jgi:hypothetical protein
MPKVLNRKEPLQRQMNSPSAALEDDQAYKG